MKDNNKDNRENRKPLTYTAVDWNSYKIKKEEKDAHTSRKSGREWSRPEVDDKWAVDNSGQDKPAYDFASDEEFNKALMEADGKQADKSSREKEKKAAEAAADGPKKEVKKEKKEASSSGTRSRKKKSLGTKLDELGSTWVSSGNFRNKEDLDDVSLKDLENNIIVEAKKRTSDELLSKAVEEVNSALRDENGYEPLGEVSLADTFEIPKLDIHFGDTADLKDVKKDLKELKDEDLKKEIEKLDLAASIEAQTKKEIKEADDAENAEKIIVKSDELKKKKKKKKSSAKKEAGTQKPETEKALEESKELNEIFEKEPIKAEISEAEPVKKARTKKKTAGKETVGEQGAETKPVRKTRVKKEKAETEPVKKTRAKKEAARKESAKAAKAEKEPVKKTRLKKEPAKETRAEAAPVKEKVKKDLFKRDKAGTEPAKKEPVKESAGKTGPSDFRKKSADWKDKKTIDKTAKVVTFEERKKQFVERIKKVTPIQWTIAAMGVIIFITGIMTTAAYANYQGEENKALALKSLTQYKDDESYTAVATAAEEIMPEVMDEPEAEPAKALSLEMTSVEKDLKIKLVDDDDTLVKDVTWSVTVSEDKGDDSVSDDGEVYEDDDMDGTIYIENIAAGDYSVVLNPSDSLADYILPKDKQLVSVKAAIEYKVIANIKDEIKSEKEVNVALEDPNGNQAADVEVEGPANTDTVEWCESTKEANGEEYVEATPDISKTAASVKKNKGFLTALKQLGAGTRSNAFGNAAMGFSLPVGYTVATSDEIMDPAPQNQEEQNQEEHKEETEPTPVPTLTPTEELTPVTPTPTPGLISDDASLSITGSSSVAVGSSVTLTATFKPDNSSVSWNVSDSSIASISDNGTTCQVTGVKAGEVTIYANCSNGKETTMKITVTEGEAAYSNDAKLYDASKNALYVKDGDEYRLATYGDYKSGNYSTYYRKQEAFLYTGWQEIDGHTYYYRSDHTYVTGEQIIQGIKYNFASDGTLTKGSGTLGIDVSKYQPNINWAAVKASGVNYVIIRCGYRGASTGVLIQDPYFTSHIKGAKAAGLKVGVYFFTTALNETEAVEEASMCAALCSGYGINYPVFMDCESSSRPGYNELSASERTAIIKAFCNTIKSAGYTPGVYANKTWLSSKMNASSLSGAKIWLAQYNPAGPTYSGRYDLWQYTSKGHVDGISGNVDMNQSYLGY